MARAWPQPHPSRHGRDDVAGNRRKLSYEALLLRKNVAQKCLHIPYVKLASEDVALLEADPAKRQRYVELVKYTWLPPLRVVAKLVETQVGTRGRPRPYR